MPPHRELPPLSSFARMSAPPGTSLPQPPLQCQGIEYMQQWLQAKAEEDRRKQEEEKTRQEALKLELRKTEGQILADALRGGVPPHMIPGLFANLTGMNKSSSESDHQYMPGRFLAQPPQRSFSGPPAVTTPYPPMVLLPPHSSSSQHGIHPQQPPGNLTYPGYPAPGSVGVTPTTGVPPARSSAPSPVPAQLPAQPRPIEDEPRILPDIAGGHVPPLPPVQVNPNPDPPKRRLTFQFWTPPGLRTPSLRKPQSEDPISPSESASQAQSNSRSSASPRKRKSRAKLGRAAAPPKRLKKIPPRLTRAAESSFAIGEPSQQQRQDKGSSESVAEESLIGNRSLPEQISSESQVNRSNSNTKLESQSRSSEKDLQDSPLSLYEPSDEDSISEAS
ncbi:hypothetical protein N7466_008840 [Penicillium verhagenii]|uniref:uncharacterized protein n=1 Tax=Penicillium verhagenii TaxID=1562060 RepID=UPI002544DC50|nr:uncharacterized protein N7466_008840 [Penicillium verhagenii]KAJ5924653.1 hypothetical protein N7466_008840 [Penicillium verhagenii]